MKTIQFFYAVCLAFVASFSIFAQREKSILLPATEAKNVTNQCSRPSPKDFSDTWEPSKEEIEKMETNLSKIKKLKVKKCCIKGEKIENPEEFYMQYIGIIVEGKKLIYINAFSEHGIMQMVQNEDSSFTLTKSDKWKKSAVIICDGGNEWGVLYNPKKKKFFDLAINGIA
jgi:hypothetical protein